MFQSFKWDVSWEGRREGLRTQGPEKGNMKMTRAVNVGGGGTNIWVTY